jgi:predicted Zn-dependent peptidase
MMHFSTFDMYRETTQLHNGIPVVLFRKKGLPLHLRAVFLAGSRFDPPQKEGIAHFTEHSVFTGTKSFPTKEALSLFLRRYGGVYNATTFPEQLHFFLSLGDPADLEAGVTFLSEILRYPQSPQAAIENERNVILSELHDSLANPIKLLWIQFRRHFFQETTLFSLYSNLGTPESLQSINYEDITNFQKKLLVQFPLVLMAAGDVPIEVLQNTLDSRFGDLARTRIWPLEKEEMAIVQKEKVNVFKKDN